MTFFGFVFFFKLRVKHTHTHTHTHTLNLTLSFTFTAFVEGQPLGTTTTPYSMASNTNHLHTFGIKNISNTIRMKLINFLIFMGHVCVCFCLCVFCCFSSVAQSCPTLCNPHGLQTAARKSFLSFTISWSLLKLMSTELVIPSTILSFVVLFSCLQSFPS